MSSFNTHLCESVRVHVHKSTFESGWVTITARRRHLDGTLADTVDVSFFSEDIERLHDSFREAFTPSAAEQRNG